MTVNEAKREYDRVVDDLKSRGTYACEVEYNPNGDWVGMVFEKNYDYTDFREQVHFAKLVFNGSQTLN